MTELRLNVPDISCAHCKSAIEGAVGSLDGVETVGVTIDARTVDVVFGEATSLEDIVAAIEGQGYEVATQA